MAATRAIVAEVGVRAASLSAISERAGIGKPTLYLRWSNKAELLSSALKGIDVSETTRLRLQDAAAAIDALLEEPEGRFLLEVLVGPGGDLVSSLPAPESDAAITALWLRGRPGGAGLEGLA